MNDLSDDNLKNILQYILSQPAEAEWFELKHDNADPVTLGKNVSAIMNSLIRFDMARGYIVWGVDDDSREIVGTKFVPETKKYKNEELLFWLTKMVAPHPELSFRTLEFDEGVRVVFLVINALPTSISKFNGVAWIRIGSNTTELKNYPSIEREIWQKVLSYDFEADVAEPNLDRARVEELLDFDAMYNMRTRGTSVERDALFEEAVSCGMVIANKDSTYSITNLGALLYARNLADFRNLVNKTLRIIEYNGDSKIETRYEERMQGGYLVEFDKAYRIILERLVDHEEIGEDGIRKKVYRLPYVAVRELLANALMHQDFTVGGLHPMVEIFSNRVEFTNAGSLLVPDNRLVDFPPRTRNEGMAREFYNVSVSESRGTGWDKIAVVSPVFGCPTPQLEKLEGSIRVTLMERRGLKDMTFDEKMWTIYLYACYLWVSKKYLTNQELRKLFQLSDKDNSVASRLLAQAAKLNYLRVFDINSSPRDRKYLPVYVEQ
ncbi:putative DNA binding domain-containing protein [Candidatus Saccharibacteria bacterium]|nr:putative DNA binding domain-containing protein [Candidatus Saccharibacteria bacterium]